MRRLVLICTVGLASCVIGPDQLTLQGPDASSSIDAALDMTIVDPYDVKDEDKPDGGAEDMTDRPPTALPRFFDIAIADRTVCALERSSQDVYCWGSNVDQLLMQTADSGISQHGPFLRMGFPPLQILAAGARHMCGFGDGNVYCWGGNRERQSIDNPNESLSEPTVVLQDVDVNSLSAGDVHTCASYMSGTLWCWGANAFGMLEPSATFGPCPCESSDACINDVCVEKLGPTGIQVDDVRTVAAGAQHTCVARQDRQLACWGSNEGGRIDPERDPIVTTPTRVGDQVSNVDVDTITCTVDASGRVQCRGDNSQGQTGPVPQLQANEVVVGREHTCAVTQAGSVWCWGLWHRMSATTAVEFAPPPGERFLSVAAGNYVTCASTAAELYCWGDNSGDGLVGQFEADQPIDGTFTEPTLVDL